jgi:3-methyladenine DNA glycosylase Mpg
MHIYLVKLSKKFFARKSSKVAPELIGRYIVRREEGWLLKGMIVETGAYEGYGGGAKEGLLYAPGKMHFFPMPGGYSMFAIATEKKGKPSVVTIRRILLPCERKKVISPGLIARSLAIVRKEFEGKYIDGDEIWIEGQAVEERYVQYISRAEEPSMSRNCLGYYRLRLFEVEPILKSSRTLLRQTKSSSQKEK